MNTEFITLWKLGVGPVLVRYEDIITMELTPCGFTRIEFGYGEHLIVEQTPIQIFEIVRKIEDLQSQIEEIKNNATKNS